MLLSNEVYIKWNPANIKWYTNKGYVYTKDNMGKLFKVNISDLSRGANVYVTIECDCCHKNKEWMWRDYLKQVKIGGETYCQNCALKLYGHKNQIKSRFKNSISFEQWCIENNRQDLLNRWDYKLNNCKPSDISYGTNKSFYFKCQKGVHESEYRKISVITINNIMCNCQMCNSFAQHLIDIYDEYALDLYWDWDKNNKIKINPWLVDYASKKKVWIKCQEKDYHGSYKVSCANFIVGGNRCTYCSSSDKVHILDSLGFIFSKVHNIWSDKNKKSPYDYAPRSNKEVWWKCPENKHNDYLRIINDSSSRNFNCPKCVRERDESYLQEKTRKYLESMNYIILHELNCTITPKNPKTKRYLPFDNEIVELKLIIEVHGQQHYSENSVLWFRKNYNLHKRQLYDRYKRMYAKSKGYYYLEIPYWTDNTKEAWKHLINNKIESIRLNCQRCLN